jgi:glycolate oxidase iron-sulfur subunit
VTLKPVLRTKTPKPAAITYHDPCHLKKALDVSAEPRAVLQANPGYQLKEMPQADACCYLQPIEMLIG